MTVLIITASLSLVTVIVSAYFARDTQKTHKRIRDINRRREHDERRD